MKKTSLMAVAALFLMALPTTAQTTRSDVKTMLSSRQGNWKRVGQAAANYSQVATTQDAATAILKPVARKATAKTSRTLPTAAPRKAGDKPTFIYAIQVYASNWGSNSAYGVYELEATENGTARPLVTGSQFNATGSGVYKDGKLWFNNYTQGGFGPMGDIYCYDTETWTQLSDDFFFLNPGMVVNDATYDKTTGNVYAVGYTDDFTGWTFGTIDYEGKTRNVIAQTDSLFLALTSTPDGKLYAIRSDGKLATFDKTTGRYTIVGDTGYDPQYLQSAVYDPKSGSIFWAACGGEQGAMLLKVDPLTAKTEVVKEFAFNDEFVCLYIPDPKADDDAPDVTTGLKTAFSKDELTGSVTFTMPTRTYTWENISEEMDYVVRANDDVKATGKAMPGEKVTADVTVDADGLYTISARAKNGVGEGPAAEKTFWIGMDQPKGVGSLQLKKGSGDKDIVLTWTAPTAGVHGGYIDRTRFTYSVVRMPDGVAVAEGLTERRFTETIESDELKNYSYEVTAYIGTTKGETARSNSLAVGTVAEIPYEEHFDDIAVLNNMFTIVDANNDKVMWFGGTDEEGNSCVEYDYNNDMKTGGNDWLYTPPLHLTANQFYKLTFTTTGNFLADEMLEVAFGKLKNPATMNKNIIMEKTTIGQDKKTHEVVFRVPGEDTYYIGFHECSAPNTYVLYLDDICIDFSSSFDTPDTVKNLTVTPGAEGAHTATISFTTPTTAVNGETLTALTQVVVKRNGKVFRTIDNPAPGTTLTVEDEQAGADVAADAKTVGHVTYAVVAVNDSGEGLAAQKRVWIGLDVPANISDLKLTDIGGNKIRLTWKAPTAGINGGYIVPSQVTYNIEDSHSYIKGNHRAGTTYEETRSGDQEVLYYRVSPQNDAGGGNYEYSNNILAGTPYALPFFESFANASTSQFWSQQNTGNSQIGLTNGMSYDNDRGSAIFIPSAAGEVGMLTSGKIAMKNAKQPVLEFYYYGVPGAKADIQVYVAPNGDAENLVPVGTVSYQKLTGAEGWRMAQIDLMQFKGYDHILVTFYMTVSSVTNMMIDAITVREWYNQDLAITAYDIPSVMVAGTEAPITVDVKNVGRETSGDYTLTLYKNFSQIDVIEGTALPSGEVHKAVFNYVPSVADKAENKFLVKVKMSKDGGSANNNSETVTTVTRLPQYPEPVNLKATTDGETVSLAWEAPGDIIGNVETLEEFEDYATFAISGLGAWTLNDADGDQTLGLVMSDGTGLEYKNVYQPQAFQVFSPEKAGLSGEAFAPHSGKQYLISMAEQGGKSDDWLISPELKTQGEQEISFWVKSVYNSTLETFELLLSSTDTNPSSFTKVENIITTAPAVWTEVRTTMPAGTKYFAIRATSAKMMLMVDDISYVEYAAEDLKLVGYHVYRNGKRVTSTPMAATTWQEPLVESEKRYQVSAVYTIGESIPSQQATVTSGIVTLAQDCGLKVRVDGRAIVVDNDARLAVSIFGADGRLLQRSADAHLVCPVAAGTYIVKQGNRTGKVIVK